MSLSLLLPLITMRSLLVREKFLFNIYFIFRFLVVLILAFVVVVGTIVVVIFFFKLRKAEKKIKRGKKEYQEYKFKEVKSK